MDESVWFKRVEGKVDKVIDKVDLILVNHLPHMQAELAELKTDHKWASRLLATGVLLVAALITASATIVAAIFI